jgi:hypothetical protein
MNFLYDNRKQINGYYFYAHNGGRFDVNLLFRDIIFKEGSKWHPVPSKAVELNGAWINIELESDDKTSRIFLRDSYKLLTGSLKSLTTSFKVAHAKKEISGIGTADLVTEEDLRDPSKLRAIREYHKDDCIGLLEVLEIFGDKMWNEIGVDITDCPTLASCAKKGFRSSYYDHTKTPIYNMPRSMDAVLRQGYKGGRCEAGFIGTYEGELNMYDFTSLYPAMATKPLPYGIPTEIKNVNINNILSMSCGFAVCMVTGTKEMLKGARPLHSSDMDGRNVFQYHKTPVEMVLFFPEIHRGYAMGYRYEIKQAWFFKSKPFMKDYMNKLFSFKSNADEDPVTRFIFKLLINSSYGIWGFNQFDRDNIVIGDSRSKNWMKYLLDGKLCNSNTEGDYRFMRVLKDNKCPANVAIASAITAYARIRLHELCVDIESLGHKILYMDTDSVLTNCRLEDTHLKSKYMDLEINGVIVNSLGTHLGGLKNESPDDKFDKAVIAGLKMYALYKGDCQKVSFKGLKKSQETTETISKRLESMVAGNMEYQTMNIQRVNKTSYLSYNNRFNIVHDSIEKSFKILYTKGIVEGGWIHPFES